MKTVRGPAWTSIWFAAFVAVALLGLSLLALAGAARYAHLNVPPLQRQPPDNLRAILCLVTSMLLVTAAIVVPLIIRKKAQSRLHRPFLKSVQVLLLVVALAPAARAAEKAGPDQTGKRRIIELTRTLEKNPPGDKDKSQRTELLQWWVSAPVSLQWCSELLLDGASEKARPIVVTQAMFGAGARLLEVGKPLSALELATAGVDSAILAYKNAVRADKSYADKVLDDLAADPARRKAYVARHLEQCAKAGKK